MRRIVLLILFVLFLGGCATWKDSAGNPASKADIFDCEQKCGHYDYSRGANIFGIVLCEERCMEALRYYKRY